ncbi:hypothetical protein [Streptacidiphilus rugosus]|uniref:hypothetical protein n=1 Tax=Streptacidiphilus rugosus TaxID=405783 RepID=UPI000560FA3B|nr:hypothetical protein [Streptacidiphilus rugosus]
MPCHLFLVWQAETTDARSAAHRFTEKLPRLTAAQRDEVIRVCTADRLDASRNSIRHLAERSRAMQREYVARYGTLRARLLGWSLAATVGAVLVQHLLLGP